LEIKGEAGQKEAPLGGGAGRWRVIESGWAYPTACCARPASGVAANTVKAARDELRSTAQLEDLVHRDRAGSFACNVIWSIAKHAKANKGKPEIIDANMLQAVSIAEKITPYRHHRLGAIKLNTDPVDPGVRENASLEELQAELLKHWKRLAPVLDLEALMAPADEITTSDVPLGGAGHD
jgi:hypothetical protein